VVGLNASAPSPGEPSIGEPSGLEEIGGWPAVLGRLMAHQDLTADEAATALGDILGGGATAAQVAAFVTALRIKGETVEEMAGLVRAMLDKAEPLPVSGKLVDTCGTGGDRSRSINVSTLAALVVAGAGARVCKHGGRAASSASGSADVLEALGVAIDLGPDGVRRCIEEAGMGFCFAPRFHPAMRHAIPVRRELGVPTVFNFLGPLANPARAQYQVVGVSDPGMADKMLGVLRANGARRAMIVYGHDGLDELSTTGESSALDLTVDDEGRAEVRTHVIDPSSLGLARCSLASLQGGGAAENAAAVGRVLDGDRGPHRDITVLNAAAGLVVAGLAEDLVDGAEQAAAVIDGGQAAAALARLVETSTAAAAG
jgi:anthranilate phosphoribosyltransferase